MLFFSNTIKEEISEISAIKEIFEISDQAIYESNLQLLNCSRDHITKFCNTTTNTAQYGIRRLIIEEGMVKELIFPSKD